MRDLILRAVCIYFKYECTVCMYVCMLQEEVELPEDRFHRKDASSSYLIQQREQAKKDKWTNFEKYLTYIHTYIHTLIKVYIHTYIRTYINRYTCVNYTNGFTIR